MAERVSIVDITDVPALERLAAAVSESGRAVALKRGVRTLAIVRPARKQDREPRKRRTRKSGVLGPDDSLFQLAGLGASGLADVSSNTHAYLAAAFPAESE
jgi:hypothetical protein